jgi:phosphatidylglycerol---prolipoprotein diacylglyceryl transferase
MYVKKYGYIREKHMDSFLVFIFIGVIGGWRLGYVLLYNLDYYFLHPVEIFALWHWGMSFHGGALGVIGALILFAYRYRYKLFDVSDPLVSILPLALGLGRIGNYINHELLGFPGYTGLFAIREKGISYFPSSLLQAFFEGIILLVIMQLWRMYEKKNGRKPGYGSALFLLGYWFLRIIAEGFRLPDSHIGYIFGTEWITLGMVYSIPMIIWGIIVLLYAQRSSKLSEKL